MQTKFIVDTKNIKMKVSDFLLCTFQGDTNTPPDTYVAEIISIDHANSFFTCRMVDSGSRYTFQYSANSSGPWEGRDEGGVFYILDTHDIYTPGFTGPSPKDVAVITFNDNKKFLCYVDSTDREINVTFYHYPYSRISIDQNLITDSDWQAYPSGSIIKSIEGCVLNNVFTEHINPVASGNINQILKVVSGSEIAKYKWKDRGVAPAGYIKGMALVYARVYCKLKGGDPAAMEMAKANTKDEDRDALAWYHEQFTKAGMDNAADGTDTLRHLFVLLIGLGMRESSGKYCEGRDQSASNTTADTAEAGLFQTSYNARSSSPLLPKLFAQYKNMAGFVEVFKEGVKCKTSDLENFGSGDGKEYQRLSKTSPAFAVEFTAIALRNRRKHWGPINRKTAEVVTSCDKMLQDVERVVDEHNLCPLVA